MMDSRVISRRAPGVTAAMIAAVVAVVATSCGGAAKKGSSAAAGQGVVVRTSVVRSVSATETAEAGGLVAARTVATVASRVVAPVTAVLVRPGDRVLAGQALVQLDVRALRADADRAGATSAAAADAIHSAAAEQSAAQAALTLARSTHGRIASLQSRGSATLQELDEATAALAGAQARLEAATARLSAATSGAASARSASEAAGITAAYGQVAAPFAGLITEKLVDQGNLVVPGTPLVRLEDTSRFTLDVRVDAGRAESAHVGQALSVEIDGMAALEGTVTEVARSVDADSRALLVRIGLPPDPAVRSGLFGRARFPQRLRTALRVPEAAVRRSGQIASVFVLDDSRARLRLIRVGPSADGSAEVLSGLTAGERVILDPPEGLVDGSAVTSRGDQR
jgi:RND family efflux transporter MFP subunit